MRDGSMMADPEDFRNERDDRLGRPVEIITSPANPTIKLARSLHRRRMRYRERAMLLEGLRTIETAFAYGAELRALLINADRINTIDTALLTRLSDESERVISVESRLFMEIAATEQPQPIIAVASLPERALPSDCSLVLAIDGLRDPGNLGTLIRSAAAAGVDAVALLPGSVDPTNPKAVRASAGTVYAVPIATVDDIGQLIDRAFAGSAQVVLADAPSDNAYDTYDWRSPTVLVVGSEADGVGETSRTFATGTVAIPMAQGVESLNAAVSGSILVFAIDSQRRRR